MTLTEILILVGASAVSFTVAALYFTRKTQAKISYMLDALEDKETNFRFNESALINRKFNRTLNRIRTIFENEKKEIAEQERYYGQMLDHVRTGIVVMEESNGRIFYSNIRALSMLGITSFNNIKQLRSISPQVFDAFTKATENHEEKASIYNESSRLSISITASSARIRNHYVKIFAINDISSDMEENEAASWTKLIRVLTHEIMNTVTPIASLSDALSEYININYKDIPDIKTGLDTISASAKGLISFVESYRNLTHIANPVKKPLYLREIAERVIKLTHGQLSEADAECTYSETDDDIILYADDNQISQILVNLIKNGLQAGADKITMNARIDDQESVILDVSNNGQPISKESQEEIFIPFFTTKSSGTGIGLSLSRQIMRLHNGSIKLSCSNEEKTVFTLIFK